MGRLSEAMLTEQFDGTTYQPQRDHKRLSGQLAQVYSVMANHYLWYSLKELTTICGGSEAGISARIRDLRKPKFGSHIVQKRCNPNGLWEYRLLPAAS